MTPGFISSLCKRGPEYPFTKDSDLELAGFRGHYWSFPDLTEKHWLSGHTVKTVME